MREGSLDKNLWVAKETGLLAFGGPRAASENPVQGVGAEGRW